MKSKEELNALKEEVEALNKKLAELSDDELAEVTGGSVDLGPIHRDLEPAPGFSRTHRSGDY